MNTLFPFLTLLQNNNKSSLKKMATSTTSSHTPNQPPNTTTTSPAKAKSKPDHAISIPDGRRNSEGETIPSPNETWCPNLNRQQSWDREDLKRQFYQYSLSGGGQGRKGEVGEEKGFTEVKE